MTALAEPGRARIWQGRAGVLALGLAMATGQAPLGWAPVTVLAFAAALYWSLPAAPAWRQAAGRGWWLALGYFAGSLFWIVEPFLVDIPRHGWMAPFALAGLAGLCGAFWALAFGLAARLGRTAGERLLWLPLLLTGAEFLRGVAFTGFPWASLGHVLIGWPQMQLAALLGPEALTLLVAGTSALLALAALHRSLLAGGAAVLLALAPLPYAFARLNAPVPERSEPVTVRLIQPNAPQHLKWAPDMIPVFFSRHLEYTAGGGLPRPDLIVWPETAVPGYLEAGERAMELMSDAAGDVPIAFGIQRWDGIWPYNAMVVMDGAGDVTHVYDKSHLVPFGEYMPLAWVFGRLGITGLASLEQSGYAAGPGIRPLDLGGKLGHMLPLICYEAIFPGELRRAQRRAETPADWILHITNDAWFGELAGPYQHLAQARLRAVEQGLPVLRSANTGVSAVIEARGRVLDSLPLGTQGALDAALPGALPPPPFQRWGQGPIALLLLLLAAALTVRRITKRLDPSAGAQ